MSKQHWTGADIPDQSGRVAIVTGANSGIGFETAKALAEKGARVIVASRSRERGKGAVREIAGAVSNANLEFISLDLASLNAVKDFAEEFRSKTQRLDILINNAGVMMPREREETADGFELQFGTNHLGHFALTLRLLDLLVSTSGSRVVNVSSSAQNFGKLDLDDLQWTARRFDRPASYGASKIANMLFTLELQRRFEEAGVSSMAVAAHPGWTSTNLQKTSPILRALNPLFGMKPWQGALPTLYAAVAQDVESAAYYGPHGMANMWGYPARNKPAEASIDAEAAKRLWALSEELVGLSTSALPG